MQFFALTSQKRSRKQYQAVRLLWLVALNKLSMMSFWKEISVSVTCTKWYQKLRKTKLTWCLLFYVVLMPWHDSTSWIQYICGIQKWSNEKPIFMKYLLLIFDTSMAQQITKHNWFSLWSSNYKYPLSEIFCLLSLCMLSHLLSAISLLSLCICLPINNTRIYNLISVRQITRFLLGNAMISSKTDPHNGSMKEKRS